MEHSELAWYIRSRFRDIHDSFKAYLESTF